MQNKIDFYNSGFVITHTRIFKEIILKCGKTCAILYVILLSHKNSDMDSCFPGYGILMKECDISRKTLINSLSVLEENKYVVIKSGEKGRSNNYYFPYEDIYTDEERKRIAHIIRRKSRKDDICDSRRQD